MKLEWLLLTALVALAVWPLLKVRTAKALVRFAGVALLALTLAGAALWNARAQRRVEARSRLVQSAPQEGRPGGYVTSDGCASCHPSQYDSWHRSFHRTMTQYATPEAVKGAFEGVTLDLRGESYRLERRGDEFWVEMPENDSRRNQAANVQALMAPSRRVWKRIDLVTGSHHMQAYWLAAPAGNLQVNFPFFYLLEDQRWVPRNDTFLMDPKLPNAAQVWNLNCIQCHSTGGQPRPQAGQPPLLDTHVGEIGIACEACHGPADEHVATNQNPLRRYGLHGKAQADPTIVNPSRQAHKAASQICGQCHGIKWIPATEDWRRDGFHYRPGHDLEARTPVVRAAHHTNELWLQQGLKRDPTFLEDRYWPDGMVRVSGREFNGLLETPCYERGDLSCLSCHSIHKSDPVNQLGEGMDGNQACLQCHKSIRVAEHTHHQQNSSGQLCYNCHMPYTTYGLLKAIRSHQIDSPSVDTDVRTGRPNACNLCHLDQTLDWTAQKLTSWFGARTLSLTEEQRTRSAAGSLLLRGDAGQRALIAYAMGWAPARKASGEYWEAPFLAQLLEDPYSTVRYIAYRSLRRLPGFKDFSYDYVSTPAERTRAHQEALNRWKRNWTTAPSRSGEPVLINAQGAPDQTAWDSLLRQRNDRAIYLQE